MSARILNRSFSGGEITPELFGRLDLSKVQEALSLCMNFITLPHGPVVNRPGTEYVEEVKNSANATRLIPFSYSSNQAFAIQLGAGYFRFHANGATLQVSAPAWSSATAYNANDMVTVSAVGYSCIAANTNQNPVAAAWVSGTYYTAGTLVSYNGVTYVCASTHTASGSNTPPSPYWTPQWRTTAWLSTYGYLVGDLITSGGTMYLCTASNINNAPPNAAYWYALPANGDYEIPNPYAAADLMDIHYTQSADVLTLVHPNYPIMELRRYGATNWRLTPVTFAPALPAPFATSAPGNPILHTYYVQAICYMMTGNNIWEYCNSTATAAGAISNDLTQQGASNVVSWTPVQFGTGYAIYKLIGGVSYFLGATNGVSFKDDNAVKPLQSPMATPVIIGGSPYPGPTTVTVAPYNSSVANAVTVSATGTGSTTYSYQVTAIDESGNESYPSATATCLNDLTTLPNKNTIVFPSVTGALRYNIYRSSYGIFGFIGQVAPSPRTGSFSRATTTMTCTLPGHGLTNGNSYYFYFSDTSFGSPTSLPPGTAYTVTVPAGDPNTFTITVANSGATSGSVTLVGSSGLSFVDNNLIPNPSVTPPLAPGNVLKGAGNNPAAVAYYQQRRLFAGTLSQPQNVWATRSGTESDMNYTIPTRDDNRLAFKISAREASAIRHIVPMQDVLFLSASCEWKCTSTTGVLTPTTINVQPQSYIGANNVQPIVVGNAALYAAARGGHIRQIGWNWQINGWQSTDSSIFAPHLFDYNTIVDMAYSRGPIPILWCVSSTGKLLGMTYLPEQQIAAWHQHTTGANDAFESVCVITENNEDMLYCIVRRTMLSGGLPVTRRFVERLHTRLYNTVADCHYVDCGATYTIPANNTGPNNYYGTFTRSGTTITCAITSHGFPNTAGQSGWFSFSDAKFGTLPGGASYAVSYVDNNNFTVTAPTTIAPVAISVATPAVVTLANHGMAAGEPVAFSVALNGTFTRSGTVMKCYIMAHGLANGQTCSLYFSDATFGAAPTGQSYQVTVVDANTFTITVVNAGATSGTVTQPASDSLPTGITAGTTYYVVNPAANTFQIAATPGGAAIATSGSQSGTHTCTYVAGAASGSVTHLAFTITGLNWLAGMTVNILADGAVVPPQVVPSTGPNAGTITLPVGASQVHIGLPLTAQLQTPPAAQSIDPAFAQGRAKNVNKVFLRTYRSSGILAGPDFADLTPYRQRSTENPGSPPNLVTDEIEIVLSNDWGMSGQICIQQSDPLPLDIASMTLEIAVGGGV